MTDTPEIAELRKKIAQKRFVVDRTQNPNERQQARKDLLTLNAELFLKSFKNKQSNAVLRKNNFSSLDTEPFTVTERELFGALPLYRSSSQDSAALSSSERLNVTRKRYSSSSSSDTECKHKQKRQQQMYF